MFNGFIFRPIWLKIIPAVFAFLSLSAHASWLGDLLDLDPTISIQKGRVIIEGGAADKRELVLTQFGLWSGQNHADFKTLSQREKISFSGITNKLHGLNLDAQDMFNSVNCHNTTLIVAGLMSERSYVGSSEIEFYIRNYCHPVSDPEPGDIGYTGSNPLSSHSFTVVGQNIIFQKRNNRADEPYRFVLVNKLPAVPYYSCVDSGEAEWLSCGDQILFLRHETAKLNDYYTRLIETGAGLERLQVTSESLNSTVNKVLHMSVLPIRECELFRQKLRVRLESLQTLSNQFVSSGWTQQVRGIPAREPGL